MQEKSKIKKMKVTPQKKVQSKKTMEKGAKRVVKGWTGKGLYT